MAGEDKRRAVSRQRMAGDTIHLRALDEQAAERVVGHRDRLRHRHHLPGVGVRRLRGKLPDEDDLSLLAFANHLDPVFHGVAVHLEALQLAPGLREVLL